MESAWRDGLTPLKIGGAFAALVAAIVIMVVAVTYTGSSSSNAGGGQSAGAVSAAAATALSNPAVAGLIREGVPADRAPEAVEVQGEITGAHLVSKLEAALGSAFGGVWYEPAVARLHVGVTSPASRRAAEAVAARAGLAKALEETPVRSTWAELDAAQNSWERRLAGPLARGEVVTWVSPQDNSVGIELSSAVSVAQRARLERQATGAGVKVDFTRAAAPVIDIERLWARCKKWAENKAVCGKPIVAGVTIRSDWVEKEGEGKVKGVCTAGPAVLLKDLSAETTETFILTAGHCLQDTYGTGTAWFAIDTGEKEEEHEIGKAVAWQNAEADVGVIEVNLPPGYWSEAGLTPVTATIAPWSANEPEPFGVPGQAAPVPGYSTCMEGQSSGEKCGQIVKTKITVKELKELAEVGWAGKKATAGVPSSRPT